MLCERYRRNEKICLFSKTNCDNVNTYMHKTPCEMCVTQCCCVDTLYAYSFRAFMFLRGIRFFSWNIRKISPILFTHQLFFICISQYIHHTQKCKCFECIYAVCIKHTDAHTRIMASVPTQLRCGTDWVMRCKKKNWK